MTYTITLTNSGNGDGKVTVTDEVPTGTTLVADSITANGSYNEENRTITWTDVEVKAGKTAEVSFKVTINSDTTTSVRNTAVIDDNKPTKEVETKVANITGVKSVNKSTAKVGEELTYTIKLTNNGNGDGKVTVTDEVPTGTTLVADSITANGSYNEENRTITWTDVEVKAGKTAEVSFKVTINSDTRTSVRNTAVIDDNKPTKEVETKVANITGVKSVNKSTAKVGEELTYTIKLTNNGNGDGTVTVTDEVPTGTTLVEGSITNNGVESNGIITWTDVAVKVGDTAEVSFKVTINSDTKTSVRNTAVIDDNKPTEEVETKVANITGVKSVDKSNAKVGDTLTYTITLTNNGNGDGKVTVTDEVPTGTTLVADSITANGSYNEENRTITWTDVEVKAEKTAEVSFKVTINSDTKTSVTNTAIIDGNTPTEEVETKVANITGTKSVDKDVAKVGDTLTYTITLTNSGNADGTVTVTDPIPDGTRIKDATIEGYDATTNTMTWANVEVKVGATVELKLEVVVNDDTTDTVKNVAKIDNKEILEKPETRIVSPEVSIRKNVDKKDAEIGNQLHYTITVEETGKLVDATGVNVIDEVPEELKNIINITYDGILNGKNVEWNNLTIAKGSKITLEFDATINESAIGKTISNTAKLGGSASGESTVKTEVAEIQALTHELTPGQTGKDAANIVLVMDLSSSMNEKIKEFTACTHERKIGFWNREYCPEGCQKQDDGTWGKWQDTKVTRLAAAKEAAQNFVKNVYAKANASDPDSKATVTVITFNEKTGDKYVGTKVLKFGENYAYTTATALNYNDLITEIGYINIGTKTTGYGTHMRAALDKTYNTIYDATNGIAKNYPNNSNYVIFLGDGEPTPTNHSGFRDNDVDSIYESAQKIKSKGVPIYSIGFGEDVSDPNSTGYQVLQGISSENKVYTANDSIKLTEIFKNLAGGMTDKPNSTKGGKIIVTPTNELYFNTADGKQEYITLKYNGETLIECKSQEELNNNAYLTYVDGKLTFDINAWNSVDSNKKITTGGEKLVLSYYIVRAD